MKSRQWFAGLMAGVAMAGSTQAALIDRGSGLIYDSDLNVTWLSDMNYAKTSGFDADGLMTWSQAHTWADNLVFGGFSDWRLPTLNASDTTCNASVTPAGFPTQYFGYNCMGGELSHLFVAELGNSSHNTNNFASSVTDPTGDSAQQIANLKLFSNVTAGVYWSGTEYAPSATVSGNQNAWSFYSNYGLQANIAKNNLVYALAVRTGDVIPATPVPEPHTVALMIAGLGVVAAAHRRRRAT